MKIIKYILFISLLIFLSGCGSSSSDNGSDGDGGTLTWDNSNWDNSNWQ